MIKILLSGGGTLGSVSSLIAIKNALPEADYLFVGTRTGPERAFVQKNGIRYTAIITCKFRRYISIRNLIDLLKFPVAIIRALYLIARYHPDLILTSGSFVSVPIALAGRLLGRKVFLHQQDIERGLANRLIAPIATVITTTFPDQAALFKGRRTVCTGNPVRPLALTPGSERKLILIIGGSSGAFGFNNALNALIPEFVHEFEIVHVFGTKNFHQRLDLPHNYTPVTFLGKDYNEILSRAQIVISRAGMATITELAAARKATILVPLPHTHQEANARYFHDKKAAIMVRQDDPLRLREQIRMLAQDESARKKMSEKLHVLFPAHAEQTYRTLIMETITKAPTRNKPVVYIIGIGGIGISSLASYFQDLGYRVLGSDLAASTVTRKLEKDGVGVFYQHRKSNLPRETSLVLYSSAVPQNNEELMEAQRRQLEVLSYNEYLGKLSTEYRTVGISGTHGKTTTTAMTGYVLKESGRDPMIIVGSLIPQFGDRNYYHGSERTLILEADEYRAHMLLLHPSIIVINNLEADHLDFYHNLGDITETFRKYISAIPDNGILIKNADDPNLTSFQSQQTVTFGITSQADYQAHHIRIERQRQYFYVSKNGKTLGSTAVRLPGIFNVYNALAAITVADVLEADINRIFKALPEFRGSWRRFEHVGTFKGSDVYSDYAHHPTAITATLKGFREFYPDKKLFVVFQPHSFDRTEKLFDGFTRSFADADTLVLTEVYDVAGRDMARNVTSKDIFDKMKKKNAYYAPTLDDAQELIEKHLTPNDILVIMGAGDIDSLARSLVRIT